MTNLQQLNNCAGQPEGAVKLRQSLDTLTRCQLVLAARTKHNAAVLAPNPAFCLTILLANHGDNEMYMHQRLQI